MDNAAEYDTIATSVNSQGFKVYLFEAGQTVRFFGRPYIVLEDAIVVGGGSVRIKDARTGMTCSTQAWRCVSH